MSDYSDIIERLEKATGPEYALDVKIWLDLVEKPEGKRDPDMIGRVPNYTASIDAAIALVERMFSPGYYRLEKLKGLPDPHHACWATAGASGQQEDAYAPTAPLALLLALFRALEAKESRS